MKDHWETDKEVPIRRRLALCQHSTWIVPTNHQSVSDLHDDVDDDGGGDDDHNDDDDDDSESDDDYDGFAILVKEIYVLGKSQVVVPHY